MLCTVFETVRDGHESMATNGCAGCTFTGSINTQYLDVGYLY